MIRLGWQQLYSQMLRFYPRAYRDAFGEEMVLVFGELLADARATGRFAHYRPLLRELRDFPIQLAQEHWADIKTRIHTMKTASVENVTACRKCGFETHNESPRYCANCGRHLMPARARFVQWVDRLSQRRALAIGLVIIFVELMLFFSGRLITNELYLPASYLVFALGVSIVAGLFGWRWSQALPEQRSRLFIRLLVGMGCVMVATLLIDYSLRVVVRLAVLQFDVTLPGIMAQIEGIRTSSTGFGRGLTLTRHVSASEHQYGLLVVGYGAVIALVVRLLGRWSGPSKVVA